MGEKLKSDLQQCEDELVVMKQMHGELRDLIVSAEGISLKETDGKSTRDMLVERREQLEKDIENYQHMLEEANDLKKSWERSESEMKNIVPSKNFTDNANAFDGTIDVSLNSVDKANVPAKDKGSRVPFDNLGTDGGPVKELPIEFDFGLLKQHKMGGWEVAAEEEEFFSFTFKWQDELYIDENKDSNPDVESELDNIRIKSNFDVILYDDRTSRIVSFDVEPGFEHQWGYGRQRFMAKKTLSEKCDTARFRAIIKQWSDQHEYELGKYTVELLRQVKNQSVETKELVQFITQQSAAEIKQVQEKTELENKVASLTAQRDALQTQLDTLSAEITKLKADIEAQKLLEEELRKDLAKEQEKSAAKGGAGGDTDSTQVDRQINWQKKIDDLKAQLEEETKAREAKEKELEEVEKKAEDALETIKQLAADRDQLKEKIDELEKNINELIKLVQRHSDANEALSSQNKKLADDLATEKGNNSTLEGEKAALANDADKAKKDLEAAKETITKTEKEITTLKVEHKKTTEEIVKVKKEKDAVTATLAKRNDQLIDAVKRAREAIKVLQPVADIDLDSIEKIEAPVQVVEPTKTAPAPVEQQQTSEPEETTVKTTTTEETVIQAEHVKTTTETTTVEATKTTETTVITSTEDPKEPEVIQAERVEPEAEPEVVEDQKQTSSVPQSNLEEVDDGEGEEVIQAVRSETPKFFPPKEDSDTQSVQSRKSSSASNKKPPLSPHIKSVNKNQTMNKFDSSMGLKEKPKKKEKK